MNMDAFYELGPSYQIKDAHDKELESASFVYLFFLQEKGQQ